MGHTKGRPTGAAPKPETIDKEQKVLALRRQGYTWDQISHRVGYRSPSGSRDAYIRATQRLLQPDLDEIRDLEYQRLEEIHRVFWEQALEGNFKAAEIIIKVMDRRAKLLALDLKHKPATVTRETQYDSIELKRLVAWYARLSETNPMPENFEDFQ